MNDEAARTMYEQDMDVDDDPHGRVEEIRTSGLKNKI
jgi:hypothetical protein